MLSIIFASITTLLLQANTDTSPVTYWEGQLQKTSWTVQTRSTSGDEDIIEEIAIRLIKTPSGRKGVKISESTIYEREQTVRYTNEYTGSYEIVETARGVDIRCLLDRHVFLVDGAPGDVYGKKVKQRPGPVTLHLVELDDPSLIDIDFEIPKAPVKKEAAKDQAVDQLTPEQKAQAKREFYEAVKELSNSFQVNDAFASKKKTYRFSNKPAK